MASITNYLPNITNWSNTEAPKLPKDIFEACKTGNVDALKSFHDSGVDIKTVQEQGWNLLHFASRNGHLPVVKYLVENGSDVNRLTETPSCSPLYLACYNDREEIAEYLLENGALPNQYVNDGMATVLHTVLKPSIAELLIERGALLGAKDAFGRIPLHNVESYELADLLRDAGSQTSAMDNEGRTPLNVMLADKNYETAAALNYVEDPWRKVGIQERDSNGKLSETAATYLYDNETTDFYAIEPSTLKLKARSLIVIAAALPFAIKAIVINLITGRISQAVRAPFFALAMLFVGIYSLFNSIEGRKALNKLEEKFNEPGLLDFAKLKKVGNLATSEIKGYARFHLLNWENS